MDTPEDREPPKIHHVICMVSDFFYPNIGGVESHIYQNAQRLIEMGHKVVVITHSYGDRFGVRYLTNGLKVYYLPNMVVYLKSTLPTIYVAFPIMRQIFIRERVTIVHGHAAFSSLCHEAILHARTMGLRAVFTDHSLFGFADIEAFATNKILKFTLCDTNHAICVSHTGKENTVLRAGIQPHRVSVIPNAVDAPKFTPGPADDRKKKPDRIKVVVLSRLVYRKGMDLLAGLMPRICSKHPSVDFLIGGDGDYRLVLEEVRERHQLHDRVEFLGEVRHNQVREVLIQGQLFLNTSLTEAFCIAIVEAASCGLLVVSTNVGGIPEVLPEKLARLAAPDVDALERALDEAISQVPQVDPHEFHATIRGSYSWKDVAQRTEAVYTAVSQMEDVSLLERCKRYYTCGVYAGPIFCCIILVNYFFWLLLEWFYPRQDIDIAPDYLIPYDCKHPGCPVHPRPLAPSPRKSTPQKQ